MEAVGWIIPEGKWPVSGVVQPQGVDEPAPELWEKGHPWEAPMLQEKGQTGWVHGVGGRSETDWKAQGRR